MKLKQLVERRLTKAECERIVRYVGNDSGRMAELVNVVLKGNHKAQQYASWPLSFCVERNPAVVLPHLSALVKNLRRPGIHDAVRRSTIRLMQFIRIPKPLQGKVADICFANLADTRETIAVRVFSMSVLANLANEIPEFRAELKIIIEHNLPYATPAFASRSRKVLLMLKRGD